MAVLPAQGASNTNWVNSWVDDPDGDNGFQDDGDPQSVEDVECDVACQEQLLQFQENLQVAENLEETAAVARQINRNAVVAGQTGRHDERREVVEASPSYRKPVSSQGWLQRDPNQLSATVQRTLMSIVAGIPRTELLTGAPVTVRLGQRTFDVTADASSGGSIRLVCQGHELGSIPSAPAVSGGVAASRVA